MIELGKQLENATRVTVSSSLFAHDRRRDASPKSTFSKPFERFSWFVRPTLVTCMEAYASVPRARRRVDVGDLSDAVLCR